MDVTNREDAEKIARNTLKEQGRIMFDAKLPTPLSTEEIKDFRQRQRDVRNLEYEMTETVQQISVVFAIVFCLCLLYLSHFWLLRGDDLVQFLAATSLVLFLTFYNYPKIKDRF
jgi:heme A synthase